MENRLYKHVVLLLLISLIISSAWFRKGEFIAGGESGLWLYDAQRSFNKSNVVWSELATGLPLPSFITRIPVLYITVILQKFFSEVASQMIIYFLLIASGMLGMFYLTNEIIKEKNSIQIAKYVSIFYLLNVYSMIQVWNRLLYPTMFVWSYLPWFMFLFVKIINEPKIKWIFYLTLSSIIFSNAFTIPTYIFAIWLPAILWLLIKILTDRKKINLKENFKYLYRGLGVVIFWIVINLWWIYPFIKVGSDIFTSLFSWKFNYAILRSVSKQHSIKDFLTLYHGFYLRTADLWDGWYETKLAEIIALIVFFVFLLGFIKIVKTKKYRFIFFLTLFSFFIIKGSHGIFGEVFYEWLFKTFPQAGIFRNPYEKFGIVWLFSYSISFGLGLNLLVNRLMKNRKFLSSFILILTMIILVWPMWTGDVYGKSVRVNIPKYYEDVSKQIEQNGRAGRVLMTPMISGHAVKYDWGFGGVEGSDFLFDRSTVSSVTSNRYLDIKYDLLKDALENGEGYKSHLKQMNIRYLIVQDNLDMDLGDTISPGELDNMFQADSEIKKINDYGALTLYKLMGDIDYGLFEFLSDKKVSSKVSKISPTHYVIMVNNNTDPFILVFKSTYDELWTAKIDNLEIKDHFVVYDYANGWKINKNGTYEIDIVFKVWPWQ